jgi:alpha-ketoglutarate-dependent taurine dioxygenase
MFTTIDLSPRAGSEIRADRHGLLNGDYSTQIEKLLVERSALVFRELFLTDAEQLQFARTIGQVVPLGEGGVSKISLDPAVSSSADYTRGAFFWHIDGANDAAPAKATMLTAKVLADEGGDTLICNTYAAYEDLPEAETQALNGGQSTPRTRSHTAARASAADGRGARALARASLADSPACLESPTRCQLVVAGCYLLVRARCYPGRQQHDVVPTVGLGNTATIRLPAQVESG